MIHRDPRNGRGRTRCRIDRDSAVGDAELIEAGLFEGNGVFGLGIVREDDERIGCEMELRTSTPATPFSFSVLHRPSVMQRALA